MADVMRTPIERSRGAAPMLVSSSAGDIRGQADRSGCAVAASADARNVMMTRGTREADPRTCSTLADQFAHGESSAAIFGRKRTRAGAQPIGS